MSRQRLENQCQSCRKMDHNVHHSFLPYLDPHLIPDISNIVEEYLHPNIEFLEFTESFQQSKTPYDEPENAVLTHKYLGAPSGYCAYLDSWSESKYYKEYKTKTNPNCDFLIVQTSQEKGLLTFTKFQNDQRLSEYSIIHEKYDGEPFAVEFVYNKRYIAFLVKIHCETGVIYFYDMEIEAVIKIYHLSDKSNSTYFMYCQNLETFALIMRSHIEYYGFDGSLRGQVYTKPMICQKMKDILKIDVCPEYSIFNVAGKSGDVVEFYRLNLSWSSLPARFYYRLVGF